ncbi:MAG: UDP-N-acetylglucosamine 2-epimerase (non-hydrolyzing) [Bacteroidia bacterium]|jgi:UDP-N-acetylglucosamine 2-epimerase (non-hydrolysing)|nr:UDP-N-acetylglucosamine 2-epimerase (non-hydrolyzing) [Bacteroidia bacterium]
MKKILIIIGTRPNFIKVTQFKKAADLYTNIEIKIVHTGQHYDEKMADVFFKQFNLRPDFHLNIPQVSPNSQMAEIMLRLEKLIKNEYYPDLVIVVGDVNSTLAAALTANKLHIKLAHLESGLRSFDRTMPEEINRIITDEISDYFFVTEQSGVTNLLDEGKLQEQIFFVGNTMIDTLVAFQAEIKQSDILAKLNLLPKQFVLMTMHRPATVDMEAGLLILVDLLNEVTKKYKVVFPIHPRTIKKLDDFKIKHLITENPNIILTDPLDYFAFQNLIQNSKFILTDSGGIQEESTYVQVPSLTLRPNTERPVTVDEGTNTLVPFDIDLILSHIKQIENLTYKKGIIPKLWDGKATKRILEIISKN